MKDKLVHLTMGWIAGGGDDDDDDATADDGDDLTIGTRGQQP